MAKKGKAGRNKRKAAAKANPISLYVRDKISAQKYWELSGISTQRMKEAS